MHQDEEGEALVEFAACANDYCHIVFFPVEALHPTGFCSACCMKYGNLACEQCEWDDEE